MTTLEFMNSLPLYNGGVTTDMFYKAGQGIRNAELPEDLETLVRIVTETNAEEFFAFVSELKESGYTEIYDSERDGNIYRMLRAPFGGFVYTYFTAAYAESRIICDMSSESTPDEFGYTGGNLCTELYQYGLPMNIEGVNIRNNDERRIDCGMMYIMRLADNSVFILDGADYRQFNEEQKDNLMHFLREITGIPEGEKVRIAGFFISHLHCDHMSGFILFLEKYHSEVILERVLFNAPSAYSENERILGEIYAQRKLIRYLSAYTDTKNLRFMQLHTGERFDLSSVSVEVLYTHEDIVNPENGESLIGWDYNNTTTVLRLIFDGKVFLFLGDINKPSKNLLVGRCSEETLKCDIVQLAHHVINDLSDFYHITKCPIALVPQSPNGCLTSEARQNCFEVVKQYATDGVYFANHATYGFRIENGSIEKFKELPVVDCRYGEWSW